MGYSIKRQPETVTAISDSDKLRVYDASTGDESQCTASTLSDYFSGAVGDDVEISGTLDVTGQTTATAVTTTGLLKSQGLASFQNDTAFGSAVDFNNEVRYGFQSITAFAGGGQGSATQCTFYVISIDTCASAGDSIKLQALTAAASYANVVMNNTSNRCDVFPFSGDNFNGLATDAAYSLAPGQTQIFQSKNDGLQWYTLLNAGGPVILTPTTVSVAGPTNDLDVTGVGLVIADTSSNDVTIGGFLNGVEGQVLKFIKPDQLNTFQLTHNAGVNQTCYNYTGSHVIIDPSGDFWGGAEIIFTGTRWYLTSGTR